MMNNLSPNDPPKRFQTLEVITFEVYGQMGEYVAKMRNLSQTGALLEITSASYKPEKGDLFRLKINLTKLDKFHQVDAEVVWIKDDTIGVNFLKKDKLIEKMISKN